MAGGQDDRENPDLRESSSGEARQGRTVRISFRLAALICLGLLAGLTWALTILSAPPRPLASEPVLASPASGSPLGPGSASESDGMAVRDVQARLYEEPARDGPAEAARMVDLAILETLKAVGQDLSSVSILEVRTLYSGRESYLQQTLAIRLDGERARFLGVLNAWLAKAAPDATLSEDHDRLSIEVYGQQTHSLLLQAPPTTDLPPPPPPPALPGAKARLAIVIDDLGESVEFASNLSRLGIPVAFAIWPSASNSQRIAALARKANMEVLLHQPMEPRSYPEDDPGKGAMFISMNEAAIRAVIMENLAHFPMAVGLNNHMGSRFTEDRRGMSVVMDELRSRGLFYLDSMTSAKSVGTSVGKKAGTPVLRRDVFLDNVADVDAILLQLRKAENVALKHGQAVAIGHPYPETLQALRAWVAQRDTRVEAVTLSSLLHPAARPTAAATTGKSRSGAKLPQAKQPLSPNTHPQVQPKTPPAQQSHTPIGEPPYLPPSESQPIEITPLP
ncbi:hypothetical protein PCS_02444 [Desulfocurvibacter africanus PCS]|uniref:Divergent polysaccharide deacetylase n=1 Tax=Desulfocurvibacter africanus PCS TaxID=1262666 RepID=M5PRI4_DESAF|nr:divergent polysaccharide deacetylase family protein [Desulfocurvibacter africanus]EMG36749.1 hypothetical protein PCS_02444 [Desulfocurvibacter africanus PCS]